MPIRSARAAVGQSNCRTGLLSFFASCIGQRCVGREQPIRVLRQLIWCSKRFPVAR
jgi:hypothetical protein